MSAGDSSLPDSTGNPRLVIRGRLFNTRTFTLAFTIHDAPEKSKKEEVAGDLDHFSSEKAAFANQFSTFTLTSKSGAALFIKRVFKKFSICTRTAL